MMRLSMGARNSARPATRLSTEERLKIATHSLSLRLELILALRGVKYELGAACPKCGRMLKPLEIIQGFNQDPADLTTRCTGCAHRFEPRATWLRLGTANCFPFYCACQTLAQLPGKETISPEEFAQKEPAIFHSAIVHFGSLAKAFAEIGRAYPFPEIKDWKGKIMPFLGLLPDTVIAASAGQSVRVIRKLRHKQGIAPYSRRIVLV